MYSDHHYEGYDKKFHGPQQLKIPGPAWDDCFQHVMVEAFKNGDLLIRRIEHNVAQLPQWRTCGHVRVLVNADGEVPEIEDCLEPDSPVQKKTPVQTVLKTPSPRHIDRGSTPSPSPAEESSYAQWVSNINIHGKKNRTPLRHVPVDGPKLTRWSTVKEKPALRAFAGYDNMPLRQLSNQPSRGPPSLQPGSPCGKIVKVTSPGAIWTVPVAGGIARMCCLNGFQVKSGPFYSLMKKIKSGSTTTTGQDGCQSG